MTSCTCKESAHSSGGLLDDTKANVVDNPVAQGDDNAVIGDEFTSFGDYVRAQRDVLARRMEGLTRIYLDTKYWLVVRDASVGRARTPTEEVLYEKLQHFGSASHGEGFA
jgi:hypothetical protein